MFSVGPVARRTGRLKLEGVWVELYAPPEKRGPRGTSERALIWNRSRQMLLGQRPRDEVSLAWGRPCGRCWGHVRTEAGSAVALL